MEHLIHLGKDPLLDSIIRQQEPIVLVKKKKVYLQLCSSIMSQQLSTKVAAVIFGRFINLFSTATPTPAQILATSEETLRGIGLSYAKAGYVHNVCRFFVDEKITDAALAKKSDEDLIGYLTQIKGVGKWTVEMILMFTLAREDVFALDDLGIQQSMKKLYQLDDSNKKQFRANLLALSTPWKPYRTFACRYLWGWKDNEPPAAIVMEAVD